MVASRPRRKWTSETACVGLGGLGVRSRGPPVHVTGPKPTNPAAGERRGLNADQGKSPACANRPQERLVQISPAKRTNSRAEFLVYSKAFQLDERSRADRRRNEV